MVLHRGAAPHRTVLHQGGLRQIAHPQGAAPRQTGALPPPRQMEGLAVGPSHFHRLAAAARNPLARAGLRAGPLQPAVPRTAAAPPLGQPEVAASAVPTTNSRPQTHPAQKGPAPDPRPREGGAQRQPTPAQTTRQRESPAAAVGSAASEGSGASQSTEARRHREPGLQRPVPQAATQAWGARRLAASPAEAGTGHPWGQQQGLGRPAEEHPFPEAQRASGQPRVLRQSEGLVQPTRGGLHQRMTAADMAAAAQAEQRGGDPHSAGLALPGVLTVAQRQEWASVRARGRHLRQETTAGCPNLVSGSRRSLPEQ